MSAVRRVVGDDTERRLPEIYCFVNGGSPGWYSVDALTEDGEFIAGHICSHPSFGPHDMGCLYDCDWKHDGYKERYPAGYVVVWVDDADDERIMAAHAKHVAAGKDGTPWQRERAAKQEEKAGEP